MLDRTEQPIFHTWEPDDPQSWRPSMKVWANGPGQDRHLAILPEKEIRIVKVRKSDLPQFKIRIDPCQDRHLLATLLELETTLIICLWNLSMSCSSVCLSGSPNYGAGLFWVQLLVRPQTLNACNSLVVARFNALNLVEAFVVRIMMRLMAMVAMPMISLFLAYTQWHVSNPVEAPSSCILQHILSTSFTIKIMV